MADGVKFVFKTLFKVPVIILAAYLIMNVLGIVTTYFKVQGVQYGLENIVVENNYVSQSDLTKLMPQLWALGYHYDGGSWTKIPYVEQIGFIIQDDAGNEIEIPLQAPNAGGTNAANAATVAVNNVNSHFTNMDLSPMNRTQYGSAKVIGFYAHYAVLWPLTVYDTGGQAVTGYDGGNWQTTATAGNAGAIFTGSQAATTDNGKDHARVVEVPIRLSNTVVGIKYYSDKY